MAQHTIELVRHRPHPGLRGLVAGIVGLRETAAGLIRRRQPAGSLLPLVLSFGNPIEIAELSAGEGAGRTYGSFVAGLMPGYASTSFERSQDCVQVYLTPRGANLNCGAESILAFHLAHYAMLELRRMVSPGISMGSDIGTDITHSASHP